MTRITISGEGTPPTERELKPGTVTIGRKTDNDFCLSDATVSGHHAKIVSYFKSSYIEDLGSTNGTFVNGRRVRMHTLHAGDVIVIGKFELRVDAAAPAAAPPRAPAADATMVMVREAPLARKTDAPGRHSGAPPGLQRRQRAPEVQSKSALEAAAVSPSSPAAAPKPIAAEAADENSASQAYGGYFKVMVGERAGQRVNVPDEGLELLPGVKVQREQDRCVVRRAPEARQQVVRLNSQDLGAGTIVLKDMDMLQLGSAWMAYFSR